jgi:hypothetical protein
MTAIAEELVSGIEAAQAQKNACARRAALLEERCRGLRDDNPADPRIPTLSQQIDALDALYDQLTGDVEKMRSRLHEILSRHSLQCLADRLNLSEF